MEISDGIALAAFGFSFIVWFRQRSRVVVTPNFTSASGPERQALYVTVSVRNTGRQVTLESLHLEPVRRELDGGSVGLTWGSADVSMFKAMGVLPWSDHRNRLLADGEVVTFAAEPHAPDSALDAGGGIKVRVLAVVSGRQIRTKSWWCPVKLPPIPPLTAVAMPPTA